MRAGLVRARRDRFGRRQTRPLAPQVGAEVALAPHQTPRRQTQGDFSVAVVHGRLHNGKEGKSVRRGSRQRHSRPNGINRDLEARQAVVAKRMGRKSLPSPIEPSGRREGSSHQKRNGHRRHRADSELPDAGQTTESRTTTMAGSAGRPTRRATDSSYGSRAHPGHG